MFALRFLATLFSSLKLMSLEKNKTESRNHELSYALHRPENTKKKTFNYFLHGSGEKELI
jgi:hypothetical protein